MYVQPVVMGGTYDWFLNASINTEAAPDVYGAWNITGATVTVTFVDPSGAGHGFTATVTAGQLGQAHYINTTSLFNAVGQWGVSWKVSLSGTVLENRISNFQVYQSGSTL